jgi:hypothetical protein
MTGVHRESTLAGFAMPRRNRSSESTTMRVSRAEKFSQWVSLRFNRPSRRSLIFLDTSSRDSVLTLYSPFSYNLNDLSARRRAFFSSGTHPVHGLSVSLGFLSNPTRSNTAGPSSRWRTAKQKDAFHVGRGASSTLLLWYRRILAVARPFASSAFPRLCNARRSSSNPG